MKFKTVGDIKIHQSQFCKTCQQNLTVDNAEIIYGDQTAFVKCSDGFKIEGSPFVFCLRTSRWETKLPMCKIVKCHHLKTPANGRIALTKLSYNGQAKFTCDDGFNLTGSETIKCQANGNWSDEVPYCRSIYECPALAEPLNGVLVYASDSGVINENITAFPLGTFVEIKCNEEFRIGGENLISCTENGVWDLDVEDCVPEVAPETSEIKIPMEFWRSFKDFLFKSCNSKSNEEAPMLCKDFTPDFDSNLSSFELPETKEYEGMDAKLLNLISEIKNSETDLLNAGNFMTILLQKNPVDDVMRDSFRFVICLYIDLILMDDEFELSSDDAENINENIKIMLKKVAQPIYKNQSQIK